jgi:outer membrane protein
MLTSPISLKKTLLSLFILFFVISNYLSLLFYLNITLFMHPKIRIIAISLLFLSSSLYSQEPWDLRKCVDYALDNNIQVKQSKLNTDYFENVYEQSRYNLIPSLNATGSYGVSFGRALDQTTYEFRDNQTVQSFNPSISSSVTLFNGFRQRNTIEQNRLNLMANMEDLEKLKDDISLNIAAQYLQILFNEEILNVAEEQLEVTSQQVKRTQALVDAGSVARGNLLEIQALQSSDELAVINAENNLTISYLTLQQLLELDTVSNFRILIPEITDIPEEALLLTAEDIYREAVAIMPAIKSSELDYESAQVGVDLAKGSRSPRVSLSAQYGTGFSDVRERISETSEVQVPIGETVSGEEVVATTTVPSFETYPFFDQLGDNASTSLFLNLSIPIFNGLQVKYNIDNARINLENSKLEVENQKNILYRDIQQAYADALAARKKFRASEKALESMQESFKYTREKYEVGLVNTVDFNIAQSQLIQTQSDLIQSKYDFIFKTSILDFYRGKELVLTDISSTNQE